MCDGPLGQKAMSLDQFRETWKLIRYALSLVSLAGEAGVDRWANLHRAIAVLQPLFQQYPDHPGVAHYLIHATDKPGLAEQGLGAARRYAAIALDSPHALHMPSHIVVCLGLWKDSINSNIAANASAAHAAEMQLRSLTTRRTLWIF